MNVIEEKVAIPEETVTSVFPITFAPLDPAAAEIVKTDVLSVFMT